MVTVSAAWAVVTARPSARPVASARLCFMSNPKSKDLADLGPVRWMPESCRAFGERDTSVESHSGKGCERDLRPDHVDCHASGLGGDAKPDPLRRCSEKFCNDRADQRKRRVDLERVENKGQRRRQVKPGQALPWARGVGAHQVALDMAGGRQARDRV